MLTYLIEGWPVPYHISVQWSQSQRLGHVKSYHLYHAPRIYRAIKKTTSISVLAKQNFTIQLSVSVYIPKNTKHLPICVKKLQTSWLYD